MAKETPMRDHVLKMFDHLNTLEILSGEIDAESQIDIILESLPGSFNQFKFNCSMRNSLQAAEGIIKGHPSINSEEKASFLEPSLKGKGKQKKKKVPNNPNKVLNSFRSTEK